MDLKTSYSHCRKLARSADSNFYYSFLLLPSAKRQAMFALYAFLRRTDDLGDSGEPLERRREALGQWRASFEASLQGRFEDELFPALADTIKTHCIPPEYLRAVVEGVEMDLEPVCYETFAQLEQYCHHVASAVGLACIHIWGFSGPDAFEPARACGVAFQLTNILRDLKQDALQDRVYLPREDLRRFNYSLDDLKQGVRDQRFQGLMQFEIARAEKFYHEASRLEQYLSADGRRIFRVMLSTYSELLTEIKRREGDVFASRIRLGLWKKLRIAAAGTLSRPHFAPAEGASSGVTQR